MASPAERRAAEVLLKGEFNIIKVLSAFAMEDPNHFTKLAAQYPQAKVTPAMCAPTTPDDIVKQQLVSDRLMVNVRQMRAALAQSGVSADCSDDHLERCVGIVEGLLSTDLYVGAIKHLRAMYNLSLKDSKGIVDHIKWNISDA